MELVQINLETGETSRASKDTEAFWDAHSKHIENEFGEAILRQANLGWYQSDDRLESKLYNGFVVVSTKSPEGVISHETVPYN